jgi:hypothetical protein
MLAALVASWIPWYFFLGFHQDSAVGFVLLAVTSTPGFENSMESTDESEEKHDWAALGSSL